MLNDKYRIYILSYDQGTLKKALEKFAHINYFYNLKIETTPYLENIMYDSWLNNHTKEWNNSKYVGTLSWRTWSKIKLPNLNSIQLNSKIENNNYDVITFYPLRKQLLKQATGCHGLIFKKIWISILTKFGFPISQILNPNIKLFVCNYWMAKPSVMIDYINFFHSVKSIINQDKDIHKDIWSDSGYKSYISENHTYRIFKKPYFPMLPFVLERLPCFFFHYYKYKMLHCSQ